MGVPGLYGWIKKNYRYIIKQKYNPQNVSTLIIDMNTLFHGAAQYSLGYGDWAEFKKLEYEKKQAVEIHNIIIKQVKIKILELYDRYQPSDALIMAIDGCTSYAKLNQQRERRLGVKEGDKGFKNWSGLEITVGTSFMDKLQLEIVELIDEGRIKAKNIIVSPFQSKGEGEHKAFDIFYKLRDMQTIGNGDILFYGMDADIIVLSIAKRLTNIIGVRTKVEKKEKGDADVLEEKIEYLYLSELYEGMIKDYSFNRDLFAEDFTAILCLLGNDFIPRMLEFSDFQPSLNMLLKAYKRNKLQLVFNYGDKSMVSIPSLIYLLADIDENNEYLEIKGSEFIGKELDKLKRENKAERSYKTILQDIGSYEDEEERSEKFIKNWNEKMTYLTNIKLSLKSPLIERESIRKSIQKLINNFDMDLAIKEVLINWFNMINWICTLYINGMKYINPEYYYRFHLPPLIKTILDYVPDYDGDVRFDNLEQVNGDLVGNAEFAYKRQFWLNPAVQLKLALPLTASVPSDLNSLVETENVRYLYPQQGKYKENPDIIPMYGKLQSILPMPMPEGIVESAKRLRINVSRYAITKLDTTRYESKKIESISRKPRERFEKKVRKAPRVIQRTREEAPKRRVEEKPRKEETMRRTEQLRREDTRKEEKRKVIESLEEEEERPKMVLKGRRPVAIVEEEEEEEEEFD